MDRSRETAKEPKPWNKVFPRDAKFAALRTSVTDSVWKTNVALPVGASPPSMETVREWFRRPYDGEPTEQEVNDMKDKLARRPSDAAPESQ